MKVNIKDLDGMAKPQKCLKWGNDEIDVLRQCIQYEFDNPGKRIDAESIHQKGWLPKRTVEAIRDRMILVRREMRNEVK
jgi:hypothetical protein